MTAAAKFPRECPPPGSPSVTSLRHPGWGDAGHVRQIAMFAPVLAPLASRPSTGVRRPVPASPMPGAGRYLSRPGSARPQAVTGRPHLLSVRSTEFSPGDARLVDAAANDAGTQACITHRSPAGSPIRPADPAGVVPVGAVTPSVVDGGAGSLSQAPVHWPARCGRVTGEGCVAGTHGSRVPSGPSPLGPGGTTGCRDERSAGVCPPTSPPIVHLGARSTGPLHSSGLVLAATARVLMPSRGPGAQPPGS